MNCKRCFAVCTYTEAGTSITVAGTSEASLARGTFQMSSRCVRDKVAFYLHPGCTAAGLVIGSAMRYF